MEDNLLVLETPIRRGAYIGRVFKRFSGVRAELLLDLDGRTETVAKGGRFPSVDAACAWLRNRPELGEQARIAA
ncbi:hypothetical protein ABWL39_01745 [Chitinivorax sp. PXF-14]|uniref:hypothetical protein n=1 Tax=Chitinivorax sp. PXF-14 TaxID=3230488 RepID=UPI0034653B00